MSVDDKVVINVSTQVSVNTVIIKLHMTIGRQIQICIEQRLGSSSWSIHRYLVGIHMNKHIHQIAISIYKQKCWSIFDFSCSMIPKWMNEITLNVPKISIFSYMFIELMIEQSSNPSCYFKVWIKSYIWIFIQRNNQWDLNLYSQWEKVLAFESSIE